MATDLSPKGTKEVMSCAECPICLLLMPAKNIYYTPCSHTYHHACISDWLRTHNTCPQCREPVSREQLRLLRVNVSDDPNPEEEILRQKISIRDMMILNTRKELKRHVFEKRDMRGEIDRHKIEISKLEEEIASLKKERKFVGNPEEETLRQKISIRDMIILTALKELKRHVFEKRDMRGEIDRHKIEISKLEEEIASLKTEGKFVPKRAKRMEKVMPVAGDFQCIAMRTRSRDKTNK